MPYVKFVVLTSSRTGSTWLIDLLNMQPGVEAHGELFLRHRRSSPAIAGRADVHRFIEVHDTPGLTRVPRVFTYLNGLYGAPSTVGFKLMYTQLRDHLEMLAYFAIRRVRIVHLTRSNHLDVMVSEALARLTGTSHVSAGTQAEVPKVQLDAATLVDRIRGRSRRHGIARWLVRLTTCPVIEVTYEKLLNGEQEFGRIFRFLEISKPTIQLQSNLAKRGTRSHRESIANYDEVRQVLSSTQYASMLR